MARKIRILNLILITALVLSFAAIIPAQAAPPAYVIDHFDSSTETIDITWANPPGTPMSASGAVDDAAVLGGEREIVATVTGGVNAEHLVVTPTMAATVWPTPPAVQAWCTRLILCMMVKTMLVQRVWMPPMVWV